MEEERSKPLGAEFELLRLSVRASLLGAQDGSVVGAAAERVNWNHTLWLAGRLRVTYRLYAALHAPAAMGKCPPAVLEQLKEAFQVNQLRSLRRGREICLLQDELDKNEIPTLCCDDWILSQLIAERPEWRQSNWKLRYVVPEEEQARAQKILEGMGYKFKDDPLQLAEQDRSPLIFASSIAPGNPRANSSFKRLRSAATSFEAGGRRLLALAPQHWLMSLCWRGSARGPLSLRLNRDIAALWRRHPEWDGPEFWAEAAEFELESVVARSTGAAFGSLGIPCPLSAVARVAAFPETKRGDRAAAGGIKFPEPGDKIDYLGRFSPTPPQVVERMLQLAEARPEDVVFDLGCGDGRVVIAAAKKFGARGIGSDIDPERIAEAQAAAEKVGVTDRTTFVVQDLLATDLRDATVVCLYIQGFIYPRIREKLRREVKPGTRILSHDFVFPGWPPEKTELVRSLPDRISYIYLWRIT